MKNTTSVKAACLFPHIFILWLRAGDDGGSRALNLQRRHVTPDDAKISSESAFFHPCGCACTSSQDYDELHFTTSRAANSPSRDAGILPVYSCFFVKKEKSLIREANYRGRRGQTGGRQQIIRRTEGWLDKQGQTCCLAARRSCSGGGDADRTWY